MFKLICILKSVILVTTNPLQGSQSCPLVNYQHNYGQPDGPLITPSKYNPHQQQLLVQNQITPSLQTIPYLYNDQIGRLYYKVQQNPTIKSFADTNTRALDQNGIEVTRYITNPASNVATPYVKRYVIVPPEYFKLNQTIPYETHPCKKKVSNSDIDMKNHGYFEIENHKKNKKNEHGNKKNTNMENNENTTVNKHSNDVLKKKSKNKKNSKVNKRKRKTSKKNKNKYEDAESPSVVDENDMRIPRKQKPCDSKLKSFENENIEELEEYRVSKTTRKKSEDGSKIKKSPHKKSKNNRKTKTVQEAPLDLQPNEELNDDIHLKNSPEEVIKKTADVDVCFDINEDCANLDSRKTRNNCYEPKYNNYNNNNNNYNNNRRCQHHQQQQNGQRGCPANIASYLNTIMSMPQLNTNFFNPFGNFPYNFNYLYQTPQQSSTRSNESNKKRKKDKKKQKSNNSNTNENKYTNKDQGQEVTTDCEKVVELTPVFMEIEEPNEPLLSEITSKSVEKNEDKTTIDAEEKKIENDKTIFEAPTEMTTPLNTYTKVESEETFYVAPVLSQEDIPFLHDNDIIDEYYPDFTSDNIYLSKEDYDFNNFHDRYYYESDNKAEMSREKRRYKKFNEKKYRQFNDVNDKKHEASDNKDKKYIRNDKGNLQYTENSLEVIFRVPPPLEFPDFKTQMVNKDRDNPRKENKYSKNKRKDDISKKIVGGDQDKEVETVYAHSKVAKYGASSRGQKTSSMYDFTQASDENMIFSRDGDTTVIIARSLGHSEDHT